MNLDKSKIFLVLIVLVLFVFSAYNFSPTGNYLSSRLDRSGAGTISITSYPSGASLKIDGNNLGTTPLIDYALGSGVHNLELTKENYKTDSYDFTLNSGRRISLDRKLVQLSGNLNVKSNVPGEVFVQKTSSSIITSLGNTPTSVLLTPGEYLVIVKSPGYYDYAKVYTIEDSKDLVVQADLQVMPKNQGNLNIKSEPSNAAVYVTNRLTATTAPASSYKGKTPLVINKLPAAKYKVFITSNGCDNFSEIFEVNDGKTIDVKATLANCKA